MNRYRLSSLAVLLSIALLLPSGNTFSQEATTVAVPQIQNLPRGVSIYRLDNGMEVLLIENHALPMVGVNTVVRVGSAYETFSSSGMCHMLEHLLFNGTTSRNQKQLYDDVDRIGGYNNASTAEFYTNYMMVTPTANIRKGMEIQADMLFNSTLPVDKFQKEKGIVLEEISKSLATPQEQSERNTLSILYAGHGLSLPTLGTYSTIQSMSRDAVNAFYKNNYVPNNMILTVIGNFQTPEMLQLVKEIYGKANSGLVLHESNVDWATGLQLPKMVPTLNNKVFHRFYDGENTTVQFFYALPHGNSSEFFQLMSLSLGKSTSTIQTELKSEFAQNVKSVSISTRLSHLGNYLEASIVLTKDVDYTALANSLSAKLAAISFQLSPETVSAEVTKARTDFVKNIEKPHMFGIFNSSRLVEEGIEAVLASANGSELYRAAQQLESFKLTPTWFMIIQSPSAKKEKEQAQTSTKVQNYKNEATGANLIVVQNDVSNLLAVHYLVKHKAVYEQKYGKDAAKVLHDCLGQRLQSEANQKVSSRFGFSFTVNDNPFIPMDDIYLHPDFGYVRVEGLADDVASAVSFLNSQMLNFVPTEDEFKKATEKYKGISMMQRGSDKSKKLFDSCYKALVYESDPYSRNQPELKYENMAAFAKEYFNPANMIISVVSPAELEAVKGMFAQFSGEPINNEPAVFTSTYALHSVAEKVEKSGGGERSYIFWGFTSQIDPKDAPALQALSLVLSDVIVFDIREKQGMAYNMSAGIDIAKDRALFFVNQGTRPQNVEKLVPQYPKFFKMSVVDTLKQNQLEKSVNMYLGRMMFRRLSSINQAFYLGSSLYFKNDINYDKQFLEDLKNVNLADVKNVAKKYMTGKNPTFIVVK